MSVWHHGADSERSSGNSVMTACEEQRHFRLLVATLNRLTPANCRRLTSHLATAINLSSTSVSTARQISEIFFRHVADSSLYAPQYAAVIATLSAGASQTSSPRLSVVSQLVCLCRTALLDCSGESSAARTAVRRHCSVFIGCLVRERVMSARLALDWMLQLEQRTSDDDLDVLCHLVTSVGVALGDSSGAGDRTESGQLLCELLERLRTRSQLPSCSCRSRCILLNLLDSWQRGWRPRQLLTPLQLLRQNQLLRQPQIHTESS